jgi:hypothetical protein
VPVAFDPNDGLVIARQQFGSSRHEKDWVLRSRQAQACEGEMSDDRKKTFLRVRNAWRAAVLVSGVLLLIYLGLDPSSEPLPGLLIAIGAVAVGMFLAKAWKEP